MAWRTRPLHPAFGVIVSGVTVRDIASSNDHVETLRGLIHKHRLVLIRNREDDADDDGCGLQQAGSACNSVRRLPPVAPEDQLALSRKLGPIESTFYKHPMSPDPDIFRVSNDESVGCTHVGRSGWHLDGTFLPEPFAYQTMHFPRAIPGGATEFVPLFELLHSQPAKVQEEWRRLSFLSTGAEHRLVRRHPVTGRETLLFHLGAPFCGGWLRDADPKRGTEATDPTYEPPHDRIEEIQNAIDAARQPVWPLDRDDPASRTPLVLTLEWRDDDFAILDNMAVAHYAVPNTQADPQRAGVRILHRTTMLLPDSVRGRFPAESAP